MTVISVDFRAGARLDGAAEPIRLSPAGPLAAHRAERAFASYKEALADFVADPCDARRRRVVATYRAYCAVAGFSPAFARDQVVRLDQRLGWLHARRLVQMTEIRLDAPPGGDAA